MKYPSDMYAEALVETVAGGATHDVSKFLKKFVVIVAKNGDFGHIGSIVQSFSRKLAKRDGNKYVMVEYARPIREEIKRLLTDKFLKQDVIVEKINSELVAGVRVTIDEEREIDMSLAGKLKRLMR